jgi:hypothetical protein
LLLLFCSAFNIFSAFYYITYETLSTDALGLQTYVLYISWGQLEDTGRL